MVRTILRKGMSPLIATVLLMAFAVALGGMIMNWKFDFNVNSDCDRLREHVNIAQLCMVDNSIDLIAEADKDSPTIQGIKLNILSGKVENTASVLNSRIAPGERLHLSIPVLVPENARVDVIGIVGPQAEPFVCQDTPIERVEPIQPC